MKLRNKITNEICDAEMREDGIYIKANWSDEEKWFCYDLETLARGWEYYVEPKEPLIKDEKIRKAVRSWAEANDITEINVASNGYELWGGDDDWCIHFSGDGFVNPFECIKPQQYTIAELCGEEGE